MTAPTPPERAAIEAAADHERKEFASAAAEAARAGCSLFELAGGGYLLARCAMARELADLRAVRQLLARMRDGAA